MNFITKYADIEKNQRTSLRSISRNLALDGLSFYHSIKDTEQNKELKKPCVQFIYIHHTFSDEIGLLDRLLHHLSKQYSFINYSEGVNRILLNNIDRAYICFSIDDGFKNNLLAAQVFEKYGIKACFFICPTLVSERDHNKIMEFCRQKFHLPPVEFLNWNDVETILKAGHEIGSHTMTHINIANTPMTEAISELEQSYAVIKSRCGKIEHFAYPYGRYFHFNQGVRDEAFRIGYRSVASAERGCHVKQHEAPLKESLLIRRDHVILNWKFAHIDYFLKRNARKQNLQQNDYSYNLL